MYPEVTYWLSFVGGEDTAEEEFAVGLLVSRGMRVIAGSVRLRGVRSILYR